MRYVRLPKAAAGVTVLLAATLGFAAVPPAGRAAPSPVYVYWDQNEEIDFLAAPDGAPRQLVAPYNPNGQMCLLPDGSGRFVTGYNPTTDPTNPGSSRPQMEPPVGMALWNGDGSWSGKTFYVPGPFTLPGATVGGDIPPDPNANNEFNGGGTMTGCTFDRHGNLFSSDIGTAQGQFPPPDDGRIIMWFGPTFTDSCVIMGPDAGGIGPHHVDGSGGLRDPGQLQSDDAGNIYVAEAGALTPTGQPGGSRVLRIPATAIPTSAAQCAGNVLAPVLTPQRFIDAAGNHQPFALGIARDASCTCWAVSSVLGKNAIAFYDDAGHALPRTPVPSSPSYNPFGIAFAPGGDLYFVDIHLQKNPDGSFGPQDNAGAVFHVTFHDATPDPPQQVAGGYNFPISVTVCDTNTQACPQPGGATPSPTTTTTRPAVDTSSTTAVAPAAATRADAVSAHPAFTG